MDDVARGRSLLLVIGGDVASLGGIVFIVAKGGGGHCCGLRSVSYIEVR